SLSLRSLAREDQAGDGDTGSDGKAAQAVAAVPAPAAPGAGAPGTPTPAGEQTYVLDSDTSPLLPPPNAQPETPGITVFRGRAMERVRAGNAAGIRGNDSQPSESPNRGGEVQ